MFLLSCRLCLFLLACSYFPIGNELWYLCLVTWWRGRTPAWWRSRLATPGAGTESSDQNTLRFQSMQILDNFATVSYVYLEWLMWVKDVIIDFHKLNQSHSKLPGQSSTATYPRGWGAIPQGSQLVGLPWIVRVCNVYRAIPHLILPCVVKHMC